MHAVRLHTGGFADLPATAVGRRRCPRAAAIDLPVPYGPATARAAAGARDRHPAVAPAGGGAGRCGAGPARRRAGRRGCTSTTAAQRGAAAQVDLTAGPDVDRDAPSRPGTRPCAGTCAWCARRPGQRVVLQELGANIIFVRAQRPDRRRRCSCSARTAERRGLPVVLRRGRCDPHALTESKRTSLSTSTSASATPAPRLTPSCPDDACRARIEAFAVQRLRRRWARLAEPRRVRRRPGTQEGPGAGAPGPPVVQVRTSEAG